MFDFKTEWVRSSRKSPCPICTSSKGKCSTSANHELVICHYVPSDRPAGGAVQPAYLHIIKSTTLCPRTLTRSSDLSGQSTPSPFYIDLDLTDRVYRDLLAELTLSNYHYQILTDKHGSRCLDGQGIMTMGLKSLPADNTTPLLTLLKGCYSEAELLSVPGFYRAASQELQLAATAGLVIPCFEAGRIVALRIRPDKQTSDGPKYYWLSSQKHAGPTAHAVASIYYPENMTLEGGQVAITEGEFKAYILAQHIKCPVISTPGTGAWSGSGVVEKAVELAGSNGKVIIFYDMELNPQTEHQKFALADALIAAGLVVYIATWSNEYKGIDDALLAGQSFTTHRHVTGLNGVPVDRVIGSDELVMGRYLPDIRPAKLVTLIKAPKGTGKTAMVERWLATLPSKNRLISVGHRVALLEEQSRRWKLDFYQDYRGEGKIDRAALSRSAKLAICLDSLIHLDKIRPYDYLLLDEISQILRHLTASTLRDRRRSVLTAFKALIKSAAYIIALDADMDTTTYNFFCRLVGAENIEVITSSYVPADAPDIVRYYKSDELVANLLSTLSKGHKCYIATNSRSEAERLNILLRKQFPDLTGLCVTQSNSADPFTRLVIKNLNRHAPRLDYLIASPTLGTGVDISVEHFTHTFVIGVQHSTTHLDLLQHMARNRKASLIHSFIQPGQRSEPTDRAYWQRYCLEKAQLTGLEIDYSSATGERIAAVWEQDYLALWAEVTADEKASHNNLAGNFYAQAVREGHTVLDYTSPNIGPGSHNSSTESFSPKAIRQLRRSAGEVVEQQRVSRLLQSPTITRIQAESLANRTCLNAAEALALEKFRLSEFYALPVDEELIKLDDGGRLRTKLNNFLMHTGVLCPTKRDRMGLEENEKLLPDIRHHTLAVKRRNEIIRICGLEVGVEFSAASLQENGFCAWVEQHRDELYRDLGLSVKRDFAVKPVELVARILAQIGLKLVSRKEGGRGQQVRLYRLDLASLDLMRKLAKARAKGLSAKFSDNLITLAA